MRTSKLRAGKVIKFEGKRFRVTGERRKPREGEWFLPPERCHLQAFSDWSLQSQILIPLPPVKSVPRKSNEFTPNYAVHPGKHLAEAMVTKETLRVTREGYTLAKLMAIIEGQRPIDRVAATALALHGYGTMQFWLDLQANYDAAPASAKRKPERGER